MDKGNEKEFGAADHGYSPDGAHEPAYGETTGHKEPWSKRFVDSFKRDPNAYATPKGAVGANGKVFDVEGAAANTANSPLARKLKGRHLQMIAIGGSIGMQFSNTTSALCTNQLTYVQEPVSLSVPARR